MQVTYLVLAHHKPGQLAELLDAVLVGRARAVLHVDAKADEAEFRRATARHADRVTFTDRRFNVRWGDFRSVDATLTALRTAVDSAPGDYYVLLSGVDFPVKPAERLERELASGAVYMNCWRMPSEEYGKPMSRLERYYVASKSRDGRIARRLNDHVFPRLPKRNVARGLGGLQPYGGSQWWALPHECAVQVLGLVDRSPRLVRFFRRSQNPDEMFFQTVVKGLEQEWELRPALTHADWSRRESKGRSPATLTSQDLPELARVPAYFARKFDADRDPAVLGRIRAELLGRGADADADRDAPDQRVPH